MSELLLSLGYVALFLYVIHRWNFFAAEGLGRSTISWIFLLKITSGMALWAIYTYHYQDRANTDIFKFFDDSKVMYDALWDRPLDYLKMLLGIQNDNPYFTETYYSTMNNWARKFESNLHNDSHTIIRFNALARLFSFGVYHVHTVFVCFLSLIGLMGIYKAFQGTLAHMHRGSMIAVFLLPSVLFWGSGVLKESLLLFALGVFLMNAINATRSPLGVIAIFSMLFSLMLMFFLKIYVIASLLPGLIAYIWCNRTGGHRPILKFSIVVILFASAGLLLKHVLPAWDLIEILATKQHDFLGHALYTKAGSALAVPRIEATLWGFITMAPRAIFNTLIGPSVFLGGGPLAWSSGIENSLILVFLLASMRYRMRWKEVDLPAFLFCVTFVVLLFLLVGWTTTVMGAIVRYRIPALPFLIILGLLLIDRKKIIAHIPILKSIL